MFTSLRRLGLASFCLLALSACNLDDAAPESQLAAAGDACTADDACASGLCLKGEEVCAATCEDTCEGDGLVCTEGHCLPDDYCDEGFGPGCAPTTCEPGCHADATCDLQAADGPTCVCDDGFEGDGLSCTIIETNPCLEDNGGCGNPDTVQCDAVEDEGGELVAECTTINPCLTDNGGCGDPEFFACTNTEVGVGECSEVDLCALDNGGCGDPARYECIPLSGQAPICKFVASCDVEHPVPLLEDTFTSLSDPSTVFDDKPFLVVNPPGRLRSYSAVYDYIARDRHESYLSFDVRELPEGFPVVGARLDMVGFDGWAWGENGNTYLNLVDNEWRAAELHWENAPETLASRLGYWFLWYGREPGERAVSAESAELARLIEESRSEGIEMVSLKLNSSGYTTLYYSSEHDERDKHPRLTLTVRECNQPVLLPDANATVSGREPGEALGEGDGLVADRDRAEFYVRFDMSQIPVGSEIVGARLDLVAIDATNFGGDATFTLDYLTTEVWGEASVTYDSRPAAAGQSLATFTLDTSETRDPAQRVTLDTTELFETVVERFEAVQSISLRVTASGDAATFAGRNHPEADWRPRLTVIYE